MVVACFLLIDVSVRGSMLTMTGNSWEKGNYPNLFCKIHGLRRFLFLLLPFVSLKVKLTIGV
jgi:hypothetical protein